MGKSIQNLAKISGGSLRASSSEEGLKLSFASDHVAGGLARNEVVGNDEERGNSVCGCKTDFTPLLVDPYNRLASAGRRRAHSVADAAKEIHVFHARAD